jgi:hypothetical protein
VSEAHAKPPTNWPVALEMDTVDPLLTDIEYVVMA